MSMSYKRVPVLESTLPPPPGGAASAASERFVVHFPGSAKQPEVKVVSSVHMS